MIPSLLLRAVRGSIISLSDDFNRADTVSGLGFTPETGRNWVDRLGTSRILSNRPSFVLSNGRAISVIVTSDPDSDQYCSAGGGDALYGRCVDSLNWISARVRRYTVTNTTYTTEYQWKKVYSPHQSHSDLGNYTNSFTEYAWSSSSTSNPFTGTLGKHYSHNHRQESPTFFDYTHSHYYGLSDGGSYTGNTRQVSNGSTTSTYHQLILERCVAGVISTLRTISIAAPSRLRLIVDGSNIQAMTGTASSWNYSTTTTVEEPTPNAEYGHGVGRGPSDVLTNVLDTWRLDSP